MNTKDIIKSHPCWIGEKHGPEIPKKTFGRIWVRKIEDKERVIKIIKEVDDFEYEYLPDDFVEVYPCNPKRATLVYGGKFEIRTDLLKLACWTKGIDIWIVTGHDEMTTVPRRDGE